MPPSFENVTTEVSRVLEIAVGEDGLVDYRSAALEAAARRYVEALEAFEPGVLKVKNDALAFWINTYNIIVVHGMVQALRKDPSFAERGISGMGSRLSFLKLQKHIIGGIPHSLDRIGDSIIRKEYKDARAHFAVVPGAASSPKLRRGLYTGDGLCEELDEATRDFLNSPRGCRVIREEKAIVLSRIFKSYEDDFGEGTEWTLTFVARFHDEADFIRDNKADLEVRYMDYDWSPNIQR